MYIGQTVYADEFQGKGTIIEVMAPDPDDVEPWYVIMTSDSKLVYFPKSSLRKEA